MRGRLVPTPAFNPAVEAGMLGHLSVERSNQRPWTNWFLSHVEDTAFVVQEYLRNPDAHWFQQESIRLQKSFQPRQADLERWVFPFRKILLEGGFGASREATRRCLTIFLTQVIRRISREARVLAESQHPVVVEWSEDKRVADWLRQFERFDAMVQRSNAEHAEPDAPFRPGGLLALDLPSDIGSTFTDTALAGGDQRTPDPLLIEGLRFTHGVIALCWDSGLQSAMAPTFLAAELMSNWPPILETPPAHEMTVDGLLGPLMPLAVCLSTAPVGPGFHPGGTAAIHEYTAIELRRRQILKLVGELLSGPVLAQIQDMGYEKNTPRDRHDYVLVFERLYLKKTILQIRERHNLQQDAVQQRTSRVLRSLLIRPPRNR